MTAWFVVLEQTARETRFRQRAPGHSAACVCDDCQSPFPATLLEEKSR